jgi:hypothetical protein
MPEDVVQAGIWGRISSAGTHLFFWKTSLSSLTTMRRDHVRSHA